MVNMDYNKYLNHIEKFLGQMYFKNNIGKVLEEINSKCDKKGFQKRVILKILNRFYKLKRSIVQTEYGKFINLFSDLVEIRRTGKYEPEKYNELIRIARTLDNKLLSTQKWLSLEYLSIAQGFYQLGGVIRQKSIERAIHEAQNRPFFDSLYMGCLAAMEDNRPIIAWEYLTRLEVFEKLKIFPRQIQFARHYFKTIFENHRYMEEFNDPFNKINHQRFFDLINEKNIAVVGPAFNSTEDGVEIDQFDLVVRINYQTSGLKPERLIVGDRTDVAYFNVNNGRKLIQNEINDNFRKISFNVFKSQKQAHKLNQSIKTRFMLDIQSCWLQGFPNMIPLILFDLLRFKPKTIKIFKANFYLSKIPYFPEYQSRQSLLTNHFNQFAGHAQHNIISQIHFARLLYENKLVDADSECSRVLKMSDDEYLSSMENVFVKPHFL